MSKNRLIGALLMVLGALVVLTPRFIVPVCEYTGKPRMVCTYMGHSEMLAGVVIIASGIGAALSKGTIRWIMLAALAGSANVLALPEAVGYCKSAAMPCRYGTVPMLRLLGGLAAAVSAAGFVLTGFRAK